LFVLCITTHAASQGTASYASERARAFAIFNQGKNAEALPLLVACQQEPMMLACFFAFPPAS
jgi:hypothetical protein